MGLSAHVTMASALENFCGGPFWVGIFLLFDNKPFISGGRLVTGASYIMIMTVMLTYMQTCSKTTGGAE